ncbi:methionine synthase B12-independent [Nitzschia inconspicua]|uniref:Methionine synthase B12-independent n=1 Tax=Nitzschia inconspicua TaxID=303405 RepID=A0A9K3KLA8_9STRA|nr:methionine synthase B12-independent [Nitzschia inconspicua]
MTRISTSTLGFPRMGPNRELKFSLEKYWKGEISDIELLNTANEIEKNGWKLQMEASIDRITVGDHYLYDMVLTWSDNLGLCPSRFQHMDAGLKRMFAMARGVDGSEALSMKKWITSNYHYMVPEYDESTVIKPNFELYLNDIKRGIDYLGAQTATPVVLGPVSLVFFTKISHGTDESVLTTLLPHYKNLLATIAELGVAEVQIHEPALVFAEQNISHLLFIAYPAILPKKGPVINLVSFMEDIGDDNYQWAISQAEIGIISLDFTRGYTMDLIHKFGFPQDKTLGVGMIDSRNVWKIQPEKVIEMSDFLKAHVVKFRIQPSGSLQYLPWDFSCEKELEGHPASSLLSFAKQKLSEIQMVAQVIAGDMLLMKRHADTWDVFHKSVASSTNQPNKLWTEQDFVRSEPFEKRHEKQGLGGPVLPTTTIGSFPQTKEIRRLRSQYRSGKITKAVYEAGIDKQIAYAIGIQEALGLDILVHGEAERTDMVEFFAHQMTGLLFTSNGWVQSFGSRCVRPPIIWTDIQRPYPMTVREFTVAQELTEKPVKGMLTGSITILNWSFPRIDISREEQAFQLALAIRQEVKDLEKAGCRVIQVDEPALREGMPLRQQGRESYLRWAVDAFRLATGGAKSETQIHTHMCYCEFKDCMGAIDRMDTDFNSIENSRSDNATLEAFVDIGYNKGFGPGVYDIHSPVIPTVDFMESKIKGFFTCLPVNQLIVNPDCGLKTRTWPETIDSLKNMVEATAKVRAQILASSISQS